MSESAMPASPIAQFEASVYSESHPNLIPELGNYRIEWELVVLISENRCFPILSGACVKCLNIDIEINVKYPVSPRNFFSFRDLEDKQACSVV